MLWDITPLKLAQLPEYRRIWAVYGPSVLQLRQESCVLFSEVRFISLLAFYVIFLLWQRKWIILTKIKAGSLPLRLLHISTDSNVVSKVIEVTLELREKNAREPSAATWPTKKSSTMPSTAYWSSSSTCPACNGADGVMPCLYRWLSPTTSAMNPPPKNGKNPFLFYNIYAIFSPTIFNEIATDLVILQSCIFPHTDHILCCHRCRCPHANPAPNTWNPIR